MLQPSPTRQPLVSHLYTADPSAHVFGGRIYLYPSHDREHDAVDNDRGDQYDMMDYHVFSQDHPEAPAVDHGVALHLKDVPWASRQLWAPDAAEKDGRYYLYFPARDQDGIFRIGVATAAQPQGPFQAESKAIPGSFSIDPCVFRDDDGQHYVYFGGLWGGQLQCWTNGSFEVDAAPPSPEKPALLPKVAKLTPDMLQFEAPPQDVKIVDETGQPLLSGDIMRRYFEGPWVHKYRGTYYFSYSTGDGHVLVYGTSNSPTGPFTFRGRILNPVVGWTTHHSIVEHNGRWWLYYHDSSLSGGINHLRCVKVQELFYEADGSIRTMDP
jgi:beta-xylosidase